MDCLTESEISQIARQQRDVGLQRLSSHFSWSEFCDERRCFHQDFVYDVAMFAAACGFLWPDVIQAAVMAKGIFPKLEGLDVPDLLSLLGAALSECSLNITSVQRHKFTSFLTNACVTRRRLLQAVVGGAVGVSITRLHLEVQLPPTPCALTQGTDLHEWEHQRRQAELTSVLQQKVEELRALRDGSRVRLGEVTVPEDEDLDGQGVLALVRTAVRATKDQMLQSLTQEASLLSDIQQIKLQQAALATRRLHNPALHNTGQISSNPCASLKDFKVELRESHKVL
uniref:Si:dkey-100n19.2 n=1 Tax=Labrus bergylta TaxID=56723 RepID=A0A3Q3NI48_9LABR